MHRARTALAAGFAFLFLAFGVSPRARADYFVGPARAAAFQEIARMKGIQTRHQAEILALPGVYGIGISLDPAAGELVFKVLYEATAASPALPAQIEGVRVMAAPGHRPAARNSGGTVTNPAHAGQHSLPVKMGNSTRHGIGCEAGCTLGFKACDTQTGQTVWVTADHCADDFAGCPGGAPIGEIMYHTAPGDVASGNCTWEENVGEISGHVTPSCAGGSNVDAVKVDSDDGLTQWAIRDIGTPTSTTAAAAPFDGWQKSGRTTGYTGGFISGINISMEVDYDCCASAPLMDELIEVNAASGDACDGGDSGAAVLTLSDPPDLLGVIIAGSGDPCYATEIDHVLDQLGISLDTAFCVDLCPANDAADGTDDPPFTKVVMHHLVDDTLAITQVGKRFVREYYAQRAPWLALYASHPLLLAQTSAALQQALPIIDSLANRQPLAISPGQLAAMDSLFAAHIAAADPGPLRTAFQSWQLAMHDPTVQRAFLVTPSGAAPDFDGDGIADAADVCPTVPDPGQADDDHDSVGNACDNCVNAPNPRLSPSYFFANDWASSTGDQRDDDRDGYGNECDAKFPGVGGALVGVGDLAQLRASLNRTRESLFCGSNGSVPCAIFDLDTNGALIGAPDIARFRSLNNKTPGPKCPACPLSCNGGEEVTCGAE